MQTCCFSGGTSFSSEFAGSVPVPATPAPAAAPFGVLHPKGFPMEMLKALTGSLDKRWDSGAGEGKTMRSYSSLVLLEHPRPRRHLEALAASQPPPSSAPAQDRARGLVKICLARHCAGEKQSEVCSKSFHGALLPCHVVMDSGISIPHAARL